MLSCCVPLPPLPHCCGAGGTCFLCDSDYCPGKTLTVSLLQPLWVTLCGVLGHLLFCLFVVEGHWDEDAKCVSPGALAFKVADLFLTACWIFSHACLTLTKTRLMAQSCHSPRETQTTAWSLPSLHHPWPTATQSWGIFLPSPPSSKPTFSIPRFLASQGPSPRLILWPPNCSPFLPIHPTLVHQNALWPSHP